MNKQLIEDKIALLHQSLNRIRLKTPSDVSKLLHNEDIQDIVIFNLQRAVQREANIATQILCSKSDIPSSLEDSFRKLEKHKIISLNITATMITSVKIRSVAVHDFTNLDWRHIHSFCRNNLEDFYHLGDSISNWNHHTTR
ncbi:HepT-like ribonuclease domain-containing protein [Desulfovibrio sp. JC010]|uniref:type VII toxin-antitoxin system HepT family RNase toxin n=1 Tax=Desulfovibrio sp. JC010 TaxID=2593641 RepID=UPI0013D65D41|nr:HepT-like ribonuclease domain-containing protein [Desulfovibrio sp. JC010]NDV25117.1 DUF86 domain-containing protein [Desulfovibrio sp. JC010]